MKQLILEELTISRLPTTVIVVLTIYNLKIVEIQQARVAYTIVLSDSHNMYIDLE